jgi:hypothetical protein
MLASGVPVGYDDGSPGCHNGWAEAATTAPRLLSSSLFTLGEVSMDDETLRMMLRFVVGVGAQVAICLAVAAFVNRSKRKRPRSIG